MKLFYWIFFLFCTIILSNVLVKWWIGEGLYIDVRPKYYLAALVISIVLGFIIHKILKTQTQ
ncbi:MAG: hypothetical protein HKN09_11520 [Saprospiraceae bacterium]|nr:hypothetical protein [Saprospiraceae bacterium]